MNSINEFNSWIGFYCYEEFYCIIDLYCWNCIHHVHGWNTWSCCNSFGIHRICSKCSNVCISSCISRKLVIDFCFTVCRNVLLKRRILNILWVLSVWWIPCVLSLGGSMESFLKIHLSSIQTWLDLFWDWFNCQSKFTITRANQKWSAFYQLQRIVVNKFFYFSKTILLMNFLVTMNSRYGAFLSYENWLNMIPSNESMTATDLKSSDPLMGCNASGFKCNSLIKVDAKSGAVKTGMTFLFGWSGDRINENWFSPF